ncbi:MAG: ABC transporter permease [Armatimonadetes bacterium]|nr:ABC transporter permease [Armatimonadota bacterium]
MHGLHWYILRRAAQLVPVVLVVLVLNFVIVKVSPGDPALTLAGYWATKEQVETTRQRWGLDRPLHEQLTSYLGNLLRGDLGFSNHFHRPVLDVLMMRVPNTLLLVLTSMLLGMTVGTVLGVFAASRYGRTTDLVLSVTSLSFYSIPVFWFGLLLVLVFALNLKWFPFAGFVGIGAQGGLARAASVAWHMVLPSVTLMLCLYIPVFLRIARASVVEVMHEDYITTVRAAGIPERLVFLRHALRNAIVPVVQMAGLWMSHALTGVVLTETVFSWPGMGTLMYNAIIQRDYPVLMGAFLIAAVWVVLVFLIADILTAVLDPRVRYA